MSTNQICVGADSPLFNGSLALITAFGTGLTIANCVYYSKLRASGTGVISTSAATAMMWINVILSILLGIIMLITLYRLIWSADRRHDHAQKLGRGLNSARTGAWRKLGDLSRNRPSTRSGTSPLMGEGIYAD